MAINTVQFQKGMSFFEFHQQFGNEAQCEEALERERWPDGFKCPRCSHGLCYRLQAGRRRAFQCRACNHQASIIRGTLFENTKLPLTVWFLAIYLISQAKTGISALSLKRHLGVSYPTAWMVQHKLMQAMVLREQSYRLEGFVQVDDVYLGGERAGGKVGRGSENKVPFVAAVSLTPEGHPKYLKLSPLSGFTRQAISDWATCSLAPTSLVLSDGLACFNGVTDAHCHHQVIVAGGRKPRDLPDFKWVNTIIGNVKTSLNGAYHAFRFSKYSERYLGAIVYRFNRRFNLRELPNRLLVAAIVMGPCSSATIRSPETAY